MRARSKPARCPSSSGLRGWSRGSSRSPRRSGPCTCRHRLWEPGAARVRSPGRSTGRRAAPARPAWRRRSSRWPCRRGPRRGGSPPCRPSTPPRSRGRTAGRRTAGPARGPGSTGWSRRRGSRSSARSRVPWASCASRRPCWSHPRARSATCPPCRCCSRALPAPRRWWRSRRGCGRSDPGSPRSPRRCRPCQRWCGCARSASPHVRANRSLWCGTACT